jgi:hypothetical protein
MTHTTKALADAKHVARNRYAWPGGYPLYGVMSDGGALCPCCIKSEFRNIAESTIKDYRDGWAFLGADINYEDPSLYCDHCNKRIESAYAEDDAAASPDLRPHTA